MEMRRLARHFCKRISRFDVDRVVAHQALEPGDWRAEPKEKERTPRIGSFDVDGFFPPAIAGGTDPLIRLVRQRSSLREQSFNRAVGVEGFGYLSLAFEKLGASHGSVKSQQIARRRGFNISFVRLGKGFKPFFT